MDKMNPIIFDHMLYILYQWSLSIAIMQNWSILLQGFAYEDVTRSSGDTGEQGSYLTESKSESQGQWRVS